MLARHEAAFRSIPAAKTVHHGFIGGLLMHTLSICRLAEAVAMLYPSVDKDLLLCGVILHDIAKSDEFSLSPTGLVDGYTVPGTLVGHLVKKRFVYSDQVAYNTASGSGMYVSGPVTGWQSESLFTLSIIAPFAPDFKTINGVRFYAGGRFGNRRSICVKTGKSSPPVFGTIDANLSEMQAVRFRRADAMPLGSSQTKLLLPGNAIVCGDDANFSVCRVYLYVNN